MSKISKKIKDKHDEIIDAGIEPGGLGHNIAKDLARQAVAAVIKGKNSPEWRDYMKNFASNREQLLRLMGRDPDFNANDWSEHALTYITANPICTTNTVTGGNIVDTVLRGPNVGTMNSMTDDMITALDDVENTTGPENWFDDFVAEEESED